MISLESFFNSVGLYQPQTITLFHSNSSTSVYSPTEDLLELPFFFSPKKGTITTKCKYCEERMPFSISTSFSGDDLGIETTQYAYDCSQYLYLGDCLKANGQPDALKLFLNHCEKNLLSPTMQIELNRKRTASFFATFTFVCRSDQTHVEKMVVFIEYFPPKLIITKIGQEPDVFSLSDEFSSRYSKVLDMFDCKVDFLNAQKAHYSGLDAGSCCYLRRIFEKIVHFYCSKTGIDEAKRTTSDIVKDLDKQKIFSTNVSSKLNRLYALLSLSIHEIPDQEIANYFETFYQTILLILQDEQSKLETEELSKRLDNQLNEIIEKTKQ